MLYAHPKEFRDKEPLVIRQFDPISPEDRAQMERDAERQAKEKAEHDALNDLCAYVDLEAALERVGELRNMDRYTWRLRVYEGRAMLLVRLPAEDSTDIRPDERLFSIGDGVRLLVDPSGPEAKWLARQPKPAPNPFYEKQERLIAKRAKWASMPPIARSLYVAASRAQGPARDVLVCVAQALATGADYHVDAAPEAVLDLVQ